MVIKSVFSSRLVHKLCPYSNILNKNRHYSISMKIKSNFYIKTSHCANPKTPKDAQKVSFLIKNGLSQDKPARLQLERRGQPPPFQAPPHFGPSDAQQSAGRCSAFSVFQMTRPRPSTSLKLEFLDFIFIFRFCFLIVF